MSFVRILGASASRRALASTTTSRLLTRARQITSFANGVVQGLPEAIGQTPLIELRSLSAQTGCRILAKAEWQNPGGSIKDRAALSIIEDAERKGELGPGGTVIEGTAGNTGIGLAHICRARGYKCIIYMPNTQAPSKINLLKLLGAEVHAVPAVAYTNPENYNHLAKAHAEKLGDNAVWTNQFDNVANRNAHIDTTGPEIWNQTKGEVDAFTCSTGTGGTFAGVTRFLKEKSNGKVQCVLADPPGSVLYGYIKSGKQDLSDRKGSSITEGIGQGRVTDNLVQEIDLIDDALKIEDQDTIEMVYELLDKEGIYVGASSALNAVAAVQVAKKLGPGSTVVTVLCDSAHKYQDRLFSKSWLASKGLTIPDHLSKYVVLE